MKKILLILICFITFVIMKAQSKDQMDDPQHEIYCGTPESNTSYEAFNLTQFGKSWIPNYGGIYPLDEESITDGGVHIAEPRTKPQN